ncbi:MAG: hypothetical protein Q8N03_06425 [Ignavibacteria bacterium]|nr:hypothetical protein [Ignavibacteria bacterium]MDP3829710.1 hypothetical protein [Ignavibacteriaceae bacterium]
MKKVLNIKKRSEPEKGSDYWRNASDEEKIEAVEIFRQQYITLMKGNEDVQQGLQRVCRIVKAKSKE